jgi:hypothetical protein
MLGTAVLFASVVGLDVVEQRKGDIAAISGTGSGDSRYRPAGAQQRLG